MTYNVFSGTLNPTHSLTIPFIFQLIFGVRVYIDRGCRPALGLLSRTCSLLAARRSVRTCELSSDVISSYDTTCLYFTAISRGMWAVKLCSDKIFPFLNSGCRLMQVVLYNGH